MNGDLEYQVLVRRLEEAEYAKNRAMWEMMRAKTQAETAQVELETARIQHLYLSQVHQQLLQPKAN